MFADTPVVVSIARLSSRFTHSCRFPFVPDVPLVSEVPSPLQVFFSHICPVSDNNNSYQQI